MVKIGTCAVCESSLSEGVPDVFCPACALRGALAISSPLPINLEKAREHPNHLVLASGGDRERQWVAMTPVAPVAGDVIEDYEIVEKIGGNMGLVFKARHRLLDKVVALKIFPADWTADSARRARFEREMRVMGQLSHPNLVTAADARSVDSWHLVAMEWIDGLDLQQLVRTQGPLPVAEACEVARQTALALQHAHEHGLIHRDIKPSNLMLTRKGTVKVIDLGLALTKDDSSAQLTHAGHVLGTMTYCAPEQFRDASSVDIRADIYSLGCTLYHLLTGKSPYSERKTFAEVVQAHLNDPFPNLRESCPGAPAGLESVLARMTAKDPASRFATPRAVVEALEPFARGANLEQLLLRSNPQEPRRHVDAAQARRAPERTRPAADGERSKKFGGRAAVLFLLLLAVGGVGFLITNLMKPVDRDPIVVLMDTTAPGGVYDEENRIRGGTNAEELNKVLQDLLPNSLRQETISSTWVREAQVLAMHPRLVVIHRSSFFHSMNAEYNFGASPEFAKPADDPHWRSLYRIADDRLESVLGFVGTAEPQTKFLVYSRGTDANWLRPEFQEQWKKDVEERFPKLKGRITTMVIPGGQKGTFREAKTAKDIHDQVKKILGLRERSE